MAKIRKATSRTKIRKTNQVVLKDRRTGEVKASVFTKDTSIGTPSSNIPLNPELKTYGIYKAHGGVSGSLQRLITGETYLKGGSGITIVTGSSGQITITAASISPADVLTFGSGFDPYSSTYNGTASTSISVLAEANKGITSTSGGIKIDGTNLASASGTTTSWDLIVSNGSSVYKESIGNVLNLGVLSTVTLSNPITLGNGIEDSAGGASSYNNSTAVTLAAKIESSKGLAVSSSGIKVDPSTLSSAVISSTDKVLIGDVDDSDNIKYVTAQSIADLATVGSLANALTIGNGVQLDSGTTYDGSSPKIISVQPDGSTISVSASGISVLSVPNSITSGDGISTFSYDGSSTASVSLDIKANSGLAIDSGELGIDISTLATSSPSLSDFLIFRDVGTAGPNKMSILTFRQNFVDPYVSGEVAANTYFRSPATGIVTTTGSLGFNGELGYSRNPSTEGDDVFFFVSGTIKSLGDSSGKTALFGGDLITSGTFLAKNGMSGSLTKTQDGSSYLVAGNNISVVSASSGQITISSNASGNSFFSSPSLGNINTTGSTAFIGGALGSSFTAADIGSDAFFFVSGAINSKNTAITGSSVFGGDLVVSGSGTFLTGLSGSLTKVSDGTSYLIAGSNITITSASNGSVTIAGAPSMTITSGSTSVNNVSQINFSNSAIVQDLGSGVVALTGSIGNSEDGDYTDGLFTDFTTKTPVGTAVDRFNEVLKGLAPAAAPTLDDINCSDSGTNANLSFGSSQSISGYTNVESSTLTPTNNLSDVDINGEYSSSSASNDIRVACFDGSTIIDGTLNADVSADSPNYNADAFGNGDQGILYLYVNDNASAVHSVDLSSFGSGNSLNGNSSGFNLSAVTNGAFSDGSSFDTFKHRTGTYTITAADQRNGWNWARVTHVIGSSTTTTNYVEWVNDSNSDALAAAGSAFDGLSMTGTKNLSGVKYNTAGSAEYRIRATSAYKNIYPTSNITFNGTNCSVPNQSFPSINYAGGENESKVLHITGSATINADPILNSSISVSVNVPAVLKSSLSSAGSQSISGILLYDLSNTSTTTSETFRAENYRLVSGSYNAQSNVTDGANAWDSTVSLGTVDGLLFYNSRLYSPIQGGVSGDFRNTADGGSISNGPSSNVDYSGITSGTRTFYRYFQNNSGGSKSNFSISINGSGTIVDQSTSLGTSNIHVLLKIPTTTSAFSTGWMDLAVAFATGQNGDGAGCLDGSLDSSLSATNSGTFGTQSAGSNEYIMVKIEADASWTGYISSMSITWS